jgi:hypothetical protein
MSKSSADMILTRLDIATTSSPIAVFNFYGELWSCFANTVCSQIMIRDKRFLLGVYDRDSIDMFKKDAKIQ